jgi:DNA-binding MarR family transcriptional regulator
VRPDDPETKTMPTHLSKTELATILSALDGQTRNPANRDKALAALERRAAALGLTTDEILDAAPGLLDGRLSPEDWLTEITDTGRAKVERVTAEVVTSVKADPAEPAAAPEGGATEPPVAEDTATKPQPRDGTKQAVLIAMLRRPEGADLDEIAEATGWQKHTIRGAISGALKKKLGLQITSEKDGQGRRVYRLGQEA